VARIGIAGAAIAYVTTFAIAALVMAMLVWRSGILVVLAAGARAYRGIALAYAAGAFGVALLGGREGATINYLLDACAATLYALASVSPRLSSSIAIPAAVAAQIVLGFAILAPFGLVPGRDGGAGQWGSPARLAALRGLEPGERYLVEDSGLLVAQGIRPVIDDLFLYSRLVERREPGFGPVLGPVRPPDYALVVSEVELDRLAEATPAQRARWHEFVANYVLGEYLLAETVEDRGRTVLWIYRPR
jgi:hypothetical protein